MEHTTIIGIDLAKRSFQSARGPGGRVGCIPHEAEPEKAPGLRGVSASMHRCDGGVRECAPLGPRDREARS